MGTLDTFKVMKVDDFGSDRVSFRTSRACMLLGFMFLIAGSGIGFQLMVSRQSASMFSFCIVCASIALLFICCGISLICYRRQVDLNEKSKNINISESCITGKRNACYHFSEVTNIEVVRDNECLFSVHADLWIVRVYIRHHDNFIIEKVFSSLDLLEARRAADKLSYATQVNIAYTSENNYGLENRQHVGRISRAALRSIS